MIKFFRDMRALFIVCWLNKFGGRYHFWDHYIVIHTEAFYEWIQKEGWDIYERSQKDQEDL